MNIKVRKLLLFICLIFILLFNFVFVALPVTSFADDDDDEEERDSHMNYYVLPSGSKKLDSNRTQITVGLNSANLTLPNGVELINITSTVADTTEVKSVSDPVEIIFVADVSYSMTSKGLSGSGPTRIAALKTSLRTFSDLIFSSPFSDVKVDLIQFSTYADIVLRGCSNSAQFKTAIDSLEPLENTYIGNAFTHVLNIVSEIKASPTDSARKIFLINLTDGLDLSMNTPLGVATKDKLSQIVDSIERVYNILFEIDNESQKADIYSESGIFMVDSLHPNLNLAITIPNTKEADPITTDNIEQIYSLIYQAILQQFYTGDTSVVMKSSSKYCSVVGNEVFMILDTELAQSSAVKTEYFVSVRSFEDIKSLSVTCNYGGDANFSTNGQLLTEDGSNNDYGWESGVNMNSAQTTAYNDDGSPLNSDRNTPYIVKIVLYHPLKPDGELQFSSSFAVTIETPSQTYTTNFNNSSPETAIPSISVVPPFGANKNYTPAVINAIIVLSGIYLTLYNVKKRTVKVYNR